MSSLTYLLHNIPHLFAFTIAWVTNTLRSIIYAAITLLLNSKSLANDWWPNETKEQISFSICSPLIDRNNKEQSSFCITLLTLFVDFSYLIPIVF